MTLINIENYKERVSTISADLVRRKGMKVEMAYEAAAKICGSKEISTKNSKFTNEDYGKIGQYIIEMAEYGPNLFPENGIHQFSILGNWKDDELVFSLQVEFAKDVRSIDLISSKKLDIKIKTFAEAKKSICSCMGLLGDKAGLSRLIGESLTPESRTKNWLDFEGRTNDNGIFVQFASGKVDIKKSTPGTADLIFDSEKISGRWLIKTINNIFDKKKITTENAILFWKPNTEIDDKIKTMNSLKMADLDVEKKITMNSSFEGGVNLNLDSNEFESIMMAEGVYTDSFGQKILYTAEYIEHSFNVLNEMQQEGQILPVDHNHDHFDNGQMTRYKLRDVPVKHIVGMGFYNGPFDDTRGSSIEAEMDAVFDDEMELFIPFSFRPIRNSLVTNPACTICLNL